MNINGRGNRPSRGLICRPDARLLLVGGLLAIFLVISSSRPWFPLLCLSICLSSSMLVADRPARMLIRFGNPVAIASLLLLLKSFSGGGLQFSHEGLIEGGLIASRVMGAASVMILVGCLVDVTQMLGAMAWLRVPRTIIELSMLAWRYIFVLLEDAFVVYAAQRNRLGYARVRRALSSFGALAGQMTIKAIDTSRTMTVAMSQRGYDGTLPLAIPERLPIVQVAILAIFSIVAIATWYLQNHGI